MPLCPPPPRGCAALAAVPGPSAALGSWGGTLPPTSSYIALRNRGRGWFSRVTYRVGFTEYARSAHAVPQQKAASSR